MGHNQARFVDLKQGLIHLKHAGEYATILLLDAAKKIST